MIIKLHSLGHEHQGQGRKIRIPDGIRTSDILHSDRMLQLKNFRATRRPGGGGGGGLLPYISYIGLFRGTGFGF